MIQQAFTHRKLSWCPHKVHPWHSGSRQPKPWCSACWGPGFAASAQRCSHGWLVAEWWSAAASFPRWIQNWPGRSPTSGKIASTGRVWPCWMDSRFAEAAEGWFDQRMRKKGLGESGGQWGHSHGGATVVVVRLWRAFSPHPWDFLLWPIVITQYHPNGLSPHGWTLENKTKQDCQLDDLVKQIKVKFGVNKSAFTYLQNNINRL